MPVITTNFSKPEIANISGVVNIVLRISWAEQPDIDHYVIQMDSHPPVLVQNTSYVAVSESPPNTSHTVRLTAVDVCDQTSETAVKNNIMLPSQPDPDITEAKQAATDPSNDNGNRGMCETPHGTQLKFKFLFLTYRCHHQLSKKVPGFGSCLAYI